jgi:hypothetical protein
MLVAEFVSPSESRVVISFAPGVGLQPSHLREAMMIMRRGKVFVRH